MDVIHNWVKKCRQASREDEQVMACYVTGTSNHLRWFYRSMGAKASRYIWSNLSDITSKIKSELTIPSKCQIILACDPTKYLRIKEEIMVIEIYEVSL